MEALLLLTSAVYGIVMPEAMVYVFAGERFPLAETMVPWLCAMVASLALTQLMMLDRPHRQALRTFVQARLIGDVLLVTGTWLHPGVGSKVLGVLSLTLVFSATRLYTLVTVDEAERLEDQLA